MTRTLVPFLILAAVALPAAEGGKNHQLGTVLGRQVVDAGHILEVRALPGRQVLIRWGDLDKAIAKGAGKGSAFTWDGSASAVGGSLSLVRTVAFEDGGKAKTKPGATVRGDVVVDGGSSGQVTWKARTTSAWDGVVVSIGGGATTLAVQAGSASLSVAIP